jgi:hypothetical protein
LLSHRETSHERIYFDLEDTHMSLRLVQAVADSENRDDLHLSRLLVLLGSADARKTTPATKAKAVEGITKLAKLDFLLRYPTLRIPGKATTLSGAWRPRDPVDDDWGGARA